MKNDVGRGFNYVSSGHENSGTCEVVESLKTCGRRDTTGRERRARERRREEEVQVERGSDEDEGRAVRFGRDRGIER